MKMLDGILVEETQQDIDEVAHDFTSEQLDEMYAASLADIARMERDRILVSEVDPVTGNTLRLNSLPTEKKAEWLQYRTDLMDVPQQAGFPTDITWPVKPE
tara:strand:+ start:641 stop:943 length:303 start_codon:yes stop_codon:yes gene_type:complete